jgi:tetratricopeptide (TPR) repeat protein
LAVGAAVYANSLPNTFIFDDVHWVSKASPQWSWLEAATVVDEGPLHGRPLAALTILANYRLGGLNPTGFHAVNALIHLSAGVVLYLALARTLSRPPLERLFGKASTSLAFVCGALWIVHPLQTECVNYISQRTESLCGLAVLTALYCAIRSLDGERRRAWCAASVAACWLGALCKEVIAVAPLLILLYDGAIRDQTWRQVWSQRRRFYLALASCWLPVAALIYWAPRSNTVGVSHITPWSYLLNQTSVIVHYLELTFWPRTLVLDYGEPVQRTWQAAAPAGLFLLGLLAGSVWLYARRPAVGYLGLWFFICLAPTSSVVPISTEVGAERRMYLALAAPIVLVVCRGYLWLAAVDPRWLAKRSETSPGARRLFLRTAGMLAAAALIIPLSARTFARNRDYRTRVTAWWSSVNARPQHRAMYNLATVFFIDGRYGEAIAMYRATLKHFPRHRGARGMLGNTYLRVGDYARAIECYDETLRIAPHWDKVERNLALLLAGCPVAEHRDGQRAYRVAVDLCEHHGPSAPNLDTLATTQAEIGKFEQAVFNGELALKMARESGRAGDIRQISQRLELFRARQPFRFPPVNAGR